MYFHYIMLNRQPITFNRLTLRFDLARYSSSYVARDRKDIRCSHVIERTTVDYIDFEYQHVHCKHVRVHHNAHTRSEGKAESKLRGSGLKFRALTSMLLISQMDETLQIKGRSCKRKRRPT